MRQTTIRYFKPELRPDAERAKEMFERVLRENGLDGGPVRVQDFTSYRPTPTMQSLEVWFRPEHRAEAVSDRKSDRNAVAEAGRGSPASVPRAGQFNGSSTSRDR